MNKLSDPMGAAILDYATHGHADRLRVFSPMFDEDEIPVATLFRTPKTMPHIEQEALRLARGRVLDVGAGAGCHTLALQQRGVDVTAIDVSPLAVEAMSSRGVRQVRQANFFTLTDRYDTLLMLMNGIGLVGTLDRLPFFFRHLDTVLAEGGQVLCDSSDISYVFETDDGFIEYPDTPYFGELLYHMQYKDIVGEPFPWLYVDAQTLGDVAQACGYALEVVAEGDHYDYLARLTRQ